ncbi:cyclic nucleotide-binding domain-containing protein [Rhodospirillum rubrum F11]|uniref:Cyclic nucleotide-binding domain (cNMP-BD) protein n=3 Tax=Rhodospirillum rubrum TaxID=1085 RepID=Q2RNP1_RHORT|nr:cyclic nucleotide-binding domain-containing protein [Rhodospirillum rubrum]ABC24254.1 Cyclic nucleotide-binding domain (cNMP-BD) protein [Rhodospirillum rubrum ATCC 11170]AEO50005.1 cyclic nucleotide-binding domain-containing protein [Rhodospirillum rubrum F11]QXG80186.1 cyclic nucleotide-binding domain-containing protein [Rhodospirillum rubrum]
MKPGSSTYSDGAVIFREGDRADSAFFIVEGDVALYKTGEHGVVRLATLGRGAFFGESAILDRAAPRAVTAIARGAVTLKPLARGALLKRIANDPQVALKIMARLAQRLGEMESRVAGLGQSEALPAPAIALPVPVVTGLPEALDSEPEGPGMIGRLLGLMRRRGWSEGRDAAPGPAPAAPPAPARPLLVVVAALPHDSGDAQRAGVAACFQNLPGVVVRTVGRAIEVAGGDGPLAALAQAGTQARQIVQREDADLLIWGLVDGPAGIVELRFTNAAFVEDERPGLPTMMTWLGLPLGFGEDWGHLLRAVALASLEPRTEAHAQTLAALLAPMVEAARGLGLDPPVSLGAMEQAAILACYGNAAAALGYYTRDVGWHKVAVEAYGGAIGLLPREADLEWGLLHRSIGIVLQAIGERSGDPAFLAQAIEAYRAALEALRRPDCPREWASVQNRLGLMLYKVDLLEGKLESLKEALGCLQAAMQIFGRSDYPAKWAEIMNTLGQVLQVYGDHARSVDILERAVEACRQALEVRTFEAAPLLWAGGQNNLGSALFLLAKHSQHRDVLEAAAESFRSALGTYRMHGMDLLAEIPDKNLKRAEEMLRRIGGPRPLVDPLWVERPATVGEEDDWPDNETEGKGRGTASRSG